MNKKLKRISALIISGAMLVSTFAFTGCGGDEIDDTKTQLYVASYAGGAGEVWFNDVIDRFVEEYEDVSFEEGKKGVQIHRSFNDVYLGTKLSENIAGDDYEVYFTQEMDYHYWVTRGLVLDLTDLVTGKDAEGNDVYQVSDGKTIYSKLTDADKESLAVDGKYYAIPHYELYNGLSYDAGIFQDAKLFFADAIDTADTTYPGTRKFITNAATKKSPGPNGIYENGGGDDGLPSSMAELNKLVDKAKLADGVDPFCWTGSYVYYTTMLMQGLVQNLLGADGVNALLNFTSNGKPIDIVKKINADGSIVTEPVVLTRENAYLVKESAALYYALQFAEKIFTDSTYYYSGSTSGSFGNEAAQDWFMNSGLNGKNSVAIFIEGNYWYNEARDADVFSDLQKYYPETYTRKNVKFMSLPRQISGTVTEGNGTAPVMVDTYSSYAFINANIDEKHIDAAKAFLAFCYDDSNLIKFTEITGVTKGVEYNYMAAADQVSNFEKSVLEMRNEAVTGNSFVRMNSNDPIYRAHRDELNLSNMSSFWTSYVNGGTQNYFYNAVRASGVSYIDYFKGMAIGKSAWDSNFNTVRN